MADTDVTLTFDTKPFENAMKMMSNGMSNLSQTMGGAFSKFGEMAKGIVNKLTGRVISFGLSFLSIRKAMSFMPEISRTFSIAGDIIGRNLLWPLRQELIPILQRVLNWVRNNRGLFVQWGQYLANIFRVVKTVLTGVWDILKTIWKAFAGILESIFGKTVNNVQQTMNIILFKITAIIQFVVLLIQNLIGWLDRTIIKPFVEGFTKGFGKFEKAINPLIHAIEMLGRALGLTDDKAKGLQNTSKGLGYLLGVTLKHAIKGVTIFLGAFATIMALIRGEDFKKTLTEFNKLFKETYDIDIMGTAQSQYEQESASERGEQRIRQRYGLSSEQIERMSERERRAYMIQLRQSEQRMNVLERTQTNIYNTTNTQTNHITTNNPDIVDRLRSSRNRTHSIPPNQRGRR